MLRPQTPQLHTLPSIVDCHSIQARRQQSSPHPKTCSLDVLGMALLLPTRSLGAWRCGTIRYPQSERPALSVSLHLGRSHPLRPLGVHPYLALRLRSARATGRTHRIGRGPRRVSPRPPNGQSSRKAATSVNCTVLRMGPNWGSIWQLLCFRLYSSGESLWSTPGSQRPDGQPSATGHSRGGGLLFGHCLDRCFASYDSASNPPARYLWSLTDNTIPAASPQL